MTTVEPCPAHRHDREERHVIFFREPSVPGAWGFFICLRCWEAMLDDTEPAARNGR